MINTTAKEVAKIAKSIIDDAYKDYGCKVQLTAFYESVDGKKYRLIKGRDINPMSITVRKDGTAGVILNLEIPDLGNNFFELKDMVIERLKDKGIFFVKGEYFWDFYIIELNWKY